MELAPGQTLLPSGGKVLIDGGWLRVHVGREGATVNDVEVHGSTTLHVGDVLTEADFQYLVLAGATDVGAKATPALEHWAWMRRLEEEVAVGAGSFAVLVGRSGAFAGDFLDTALTDFAPPSGVRHVVGWLARNVLEILVIGDGTGADAFRQSLTDRAAAEEETVRWGLATFPRHGSTAEELWSVAVDRLLGLEASEPSELIWSDPGMTRLRSFVDRWLRRRGLALLGAEGVGRESLARVIRGVAAPAAPFIVHRGARFDRTRWAEDVARASGGALHVRLLEMLPQDERRAFWNAQSFRPSAGLPMTSMGSLPEDRLVVPELASRSADVAPIAEWVLHSVDAQLGRRRSSLRAEARSLLQRLPTPENVRSLRNVVIRGALNATGAEVRSEHLDLPFAIPAVAGVRAKVRETERREIETALQGSGWNVTEAARRMELPRRTLVYRMARLGLRRPSGS
jgi:hypothetical protein